MNNHDCFTCSWALLEMAEPDWLNVTTQLPYCTEAMDGSKVIVIKAK
ncbi:hypothetical protein LCL97_03540 [Seohaeicola saemankumensis]|nr:hypothetical protein [Seohaeicola saemankumensis]MCA0869886.1 hypothetical protein [Seohaeicola saemankumensis]